MQRRITRTHFFRVSSSCYQTAPHFIRKFTGNASLLYLSSLSSPTPLESEEECTPENPVDFIQTTMLNAQRSLKTESSSTEQLRSVSDYNSLFYTYLKSEDASPEHLLPILHDMQNFGPNPSAITFNILINGAISRFSVHHAVLIAEEMWRSGYLPSFACVSKILKKCIQMGMIMEALQVLEFMLRLGYKPTPLSLYQTISGLSKDGMIHQAHRVLSLLWRNGEFCDPYTYNPIYWYLCKSGKSCKALELFCHFKKRGFFHNSCSYAALLYGFSKEKRWKELNCALSEMRWDECPLNTKICTIIIKFLCSNRMIRKAMSLLRDMEGRFEPDIVAYNVIIHELCYQSKMTEIFELIQVIHQKGLALDSFTYASLSGGFLKIGKVDLSMRLLADAISNGTSVDVFVYNIYFNGLCHCNRSEVALSLLVNMIKSGLSPNVVTYNTILCGFCKDYGIEAALSLLDHFSWSENGPDVVSFNILFSAACKEGHIPSIHHILHRMEEEGMKHSAVTVACFKKYLSRRGKTSESLKLLKHMFSHDPLPSQFIFNCIIKHLCKFGLTKVARGLVIYVRNLVCINDIR